MSHTTTQTPVVLEPASQEFVEATSTPPFLYELTPDEARKVIDDVQAAPIDKLAVEDRWITVPADVGEVRVRIVRPPDAAGTLPVILYMHGGGWVLGNADTHDRLVRELAVGTGAAVAFVEYDRSPEAHYPVAIEQGYATARWIVREGAAAAKRKPPTMYAYVRFALGAAGRARTVEEADRYAGIPAYGANFARMGVKPVETAIAVDSPAEVGPALARWRGAVDEVVLRAVTAHDTADETLALVRAAKPA